MGEFESWTLLGWSERSRELAHLEVLPAPRLGQVRRCLGGGGQVLRLHQWLLHQSQSAHFTGVERRAC